jgi:hypothetical protein
MTKIVSFLLLILFCSCKPVQEKQVVKEEKQVKQEFFSLDIRNSIDKQEEVKLSSLASEIQYVPLETSPSCLISEVKSLKIFKDNIFILDKKAVYKFDIKGNFIQQIGRHGKGPGEYGSVFRFTVVEESNELVLYCYPSSKYSVYDTETGMFKRDFRLGLGMHGMTEFPPGKITSFTTNSPPYTDLPPSKQNTIRNELFICSLEGEYLDSIPNSRMPKKGNMGSRAIHYRRGSSLWYMDSFQDTLFMLSEAIQKRPYLSFGLNNSVNGHELKLERLIGEIQYPDFLSVEKALENSAYFFFDISRGIGLYVETDTYKFIFNKITNQLINCLGISNDIDGGMPIWPKYIYNDSVMVAVQHSYEILDHLKSNTSGTSNSVLNDLDANDNPVLAFVKLK